MAKKKLVFLSILLLVLLYVLFTTSSLAWTYDEFKDLSNIIATSNHGDSTNAAQWFLNNQTAILNKIGEDYNDYANFMMVRQTGSTNYYNFYMWNGGTTTISTSITISSYGTGKYLRFKSNGDFSWYQDYTSNISWSTSKCYALQSNTINDYGTAILENYLNYIVVEDEKDLNSVAYYLGDMRIGAKYEYSPVVKLFKDDTEIPITLSLRPPNEVNGGTLYQIWIDTQNGLDAIVSGNLYNIRCYNNDVEVIRSNYFILNNNLPIITVVPAGQITNASGDVIGSISVDAIIQAINSGDNALLNAITNSQVASGEEITINDMPMNILEFESGDKLGQTEEFFTWLLNQLRDVINDTNNVTLDIPIYNTHNIVSSNFFVLPQGALRTFITGAWWFVVGIPFIKYLRSVLMTIRSGKVPISDDKNDLLGNVL